MREVPVDACSLVSAIGHGLADTLAALRSGTGGLRDDDIWARIADGPVGVVEGLEDAPLEPRVRAFEGRNNRLARLGLLADGFHERVEAAIRRYGRSRIAVVVGTTTAGIREGELAFRGRSAPGDALAQSFSYHHSVDHFSLAAFVRSYLGLEGLAYTVSTACSSSSKVFGDASLLLEAGICDAVVVGGVDSLCEMSLRGFRSLALVSSEPCRPFDQRRAGISLGEAAGFALLSREPLDASSSGIVLAGVGASADAHHMSAPHPDGVGAEIAMREALRSAGLHREDIDYIHLHGTGSKQNDDTEARAVARVFGGAVACSSTKGWTGHCLGAAGIVGAAIACLALRRQTRPGNLNGEQPDSTLGITTSLKTSEVPLRNVLTNAFGFGGNNSSLVFGVRR